MRNTWGVVVNEKFLLSTTPHVLRNRGTYWVIHGGYTLSELALAPGLKRSQPQAILNPNFSEFRWYSPIRPRQTHGITPLLSI